MAIIQGSIAVRGLPREALYYRFANPGEWFDWLLSQSWAGRFSRYGDKAAEYMRNREDPRATEAFRDAKAHIQRPMIPGREMRATPAGGAWIAPLCVNGSPLPARMRANSKLPPLNVKVRLNTSSRFSEEEINRAAAKLARGLWEYKLAGGIVNLSLWYLSTNDGRFFRLDCAIPLTNETTLAYALSAYSYRDVYLGHGLHDMGGHLSIPPTQMDPDVLWLTPPEVDKRLAAFGLLHKGEKA